MLSKVGLGCGCVIYLVALFVPVRSWSQVGHVIIGLFNICIKCTGKVKMYFTQNINQA